MKHLSKVQIFLILGMVSLPLGTAWNATIAELADKWDDKASTRFQPDIIVKVWGDFIQACFIAFIAALRPKDEP